jgi:hypothetical protein
VGDFHLRLDGSGQQQDYGRKQHAFHGHVPETVPMRWVVVNIRSDETLRSATSAGWCFQTIGNPLNVLK